MYDAHDQTAHGQDKLADLIKDIKFAMFTTRHGNGHLHARPMTTQNKALEADDSLWFFMSKKSGPVDDIKANPVVGLVYADPSSDTYVFSSESNDIRFLRSVILQPEQVEGIKTHGTIVGVLGIVVGYGSNYLNAIAAEGRLILNNGSHRAYALRDLGITRVPCVIQKATTPSELTSVAAGGLRKRPDFYLKEPRPPVLKDYFEPRLRQVLRLRPINRHVKVRFTVETYDVYKK